MAPIITFVSSLDWPSTITADDDDDVAPPPLDEIIIQCAGKSYLAYESRLLNRRTFLHNSAYHCRPSSSSIHGAANNNSNNNGNDEATTTAATKKSNNKKEYDLLSLSSRKLQKLSYYQVLSRSLPMHASSDDIRRAYHKACLKYHPDKTGRGEDDEIFLLVKSAFDTLSDPSKRRSYDSTVDFDESIPKESNTMSDAEFYAEYGPVFERNLRFASFNDPMRQQQQSSSSSNGGGDDKQASKGGGKNKKKRNSMNSGGSSSNDLANTSYIPPPTPLPLLGDNTTPLEQVHAFYEYWIHFDSWRDFTLRATSETEHDVEAADCREEKRWMKQEIDRKVKKMKREEMARINLLVTRAMAVDPRLRRERERVALEKKTKEEAKKLEETTKLELEKRERERMELENAKKKSEEGTSLGIPIGLFVISFATFTHSIFSYTATLIRSSDYRFLLHCYYIRIQEEG